MPLLIGLTGYAGSGKDTAADYLVHTHDFAKISFADPLREEVAHAWHIPPGEHELFTDRTLKEHQTPRLALAYCVESEFVDAIVGQRLLDCGRNLSNAELSDILYTPRSPRWVLQRWGTDYRRRLTAEDYWTRQTARRIEHLHDAGQHVVVSDVRFDNEAEALRHAGGVIWRVQRQAATPASYSHASESPIHDHLVGGLLNNDGAIDWLEEQVALKLRTLLLASTALAA